MQVCKASVSPSPPTASTNGTQDHAGAGSEPLSFPAGGLEPAGSETSAVCSNAQPAFATGCPQQEQQLALQESMMQQLQLEKQEAVEGARKAHAACSLLVQTHKEEQDSLRKAHEEAIARSEERTYQVLL